MKRATRLTLFLLSIASEVALGQGGRGVVNSIDSIPNMTAAQRTELVRVNEELSLQAGAGTVARNALAAAAFAEPRNPAAIPIMAGAVREAERAFVMAYANAFARIQASSNRLSPDQVATWKTVAGSTPGEDEAGVEWPPT